MQDDLDSEINLLILKDQLKEFKKVLKYGIVQTRISIHTVDIGLILLQDELVIFYNNSTLKISKCEILKVQVLSQNRFYILFSQNRILHLQSQDSNDWIMTLSN
jgi:hypothetical protein